MNYFRARKIVVVACGVLAATGLIALYGGSAGAPTTATAPAVSDAPKFEPVTGISNVVSANVAGEERTFDVTFKSDAVDDRATALGRLGIRVLLPEGYATSTKRYPVIYLLHGMHLNYTMWDRIARPAMLRATAGKDVIIVMPDGGPQGWYTNWVGADRRKQNWEDLHIGQVIPFVDKNLRTITNRDGRAIVGMSMGGFGAMHYAGAHPDLFSSVASISGAVDIKTAAFTSLIPLNALTSGFPATGAFGLPIPGRDRAAAENPAWHPDSYKTLNTYAFVGSGHSTADAIGEAVVRESFYSLRGAFTKAGLPLGVNGSGGLDHYFLDYGTSQKSPEGTCPGDHGSVCNAYALGLALPMLIARLEGKAAVDPMPPAPAPSKPATTGTNAQSSAGMGSSARK